MGGRAGDRKKISPTERFRLSITLEVPGCRTPKIAAPRAESEKECLRLSCLSSNTEIAHSRPCLLDTLHCDIQHCRLARTPQQHLPEMSRTKVNCPPPYTPVPPTTSYTMASSPRDSAHSLALTTEEANQQNPQLEPQTVTTGIGH